MQDGQYGVCLRRAGEELKLPQDIYLASPNGKLDEYTAKDLHFSSLCQGHKETNGEATVGGKSTEYCVWNHAYRSRYPFTFTVTASDKTKLSDHIALLRVFENGRLAYTWNKDSEASSIVIPSPLLRTSGLPFDAPLDLRIVPAGVEIDSAELQKQAEQVNSRTEQALKIVADTAMREIVDADPALKGAYDCYRWQVKDITRQIRALTETGIAGPSEPRPQHCEAVPLAAPKPGLNLAKEYEKAKTEGAKALKEAQSEVDKQLKGILDSAQSAVEKAQEGLNSEVKRWRDQPNVVRTAEQLRFADQQTKRLLLMADQVYELGQSLQISYGYLSRRLASLGGDPAQQARAYGHLAEQLQTAGSPFQQIENNPELAAGEKRLKMRYREYLQGYILSPWNAVPLKTQGESKGFELDPANILPVIDVVGGRWQWGPSRFQELRVGVGGMYYADKKDTEEVVGGQLQKTTKDVFRKGVQGNLGLGTLRLGVVFPVGDGKDAFTKEFRLLFGLDLAKLITGQNLEAL